MAKFDDLFEQEFANCNLEQLTRDDIKAKLSAWLGQEINKKVNQFLEKNLNNIFQDMMRDDYIYIFFKNVTLDDLKTKINCEYSSYRFAQVNDDLEERIYRDSLEVNKEIKDKW